MECVHVNFAKSPTARKVDPFSCVSSIPGDRNPPFNATARPPLPCVPTHRILKRVERAVDARVLKSYFGSARNAACIIGWGWASLGNNLQHCEHPDTGTTLVFTWNSIMLCIVHVLPVYARYIWLLHLYGWDTYSGENRIEIRTMVAKEKNYHLGYDDKNSKLFFSLKIYLKLCSLFCSKIVGEDF